ncbi:hypothetical protein DPMN_094077 [Dreissena polymorpha]|uniref:Uncharacterized protein n=1 Tax=Dreissena polymorpha TaxID=45954 RepID=A0A9D4R367_DREPO|nr:hypothetical protein DPMN_094077 [Dreissena polymorpha]
MYGSLLHVPRRSARLSGTIADSLGISCMCSYGVDIVADCLGASCRCPSGLRDCLAPSKTSESLLQVPRRFRHRRRPSLSILLVTRRYSHRSRLSGILLKVP